MLASSLPLTSPVTPPSRSPTPVFTPPKATAAPEKAQPKADTPTSSTLEAGSPKLTDFDDSHAPTRTSRNPNSPSLGRSVNPVHILFNLRVQQFVEAVRTIPLLPSAEEQCEASPTRSVEPAKAGGANTDVEMYSPGSGPTEATRKYPSEPHIVVVSPPLIHLSPEARQKRLFELASGLYQNVKTLASATDREIYAKEVEQASRDGGWLW
jgi:hypothetical protein